MHRVAETTGTLSIARLDTHLLATWQPLYFGFGITEATNVHQGDMRRDLASFCHCGHVE